MMVELVKRGHTVYAIAPCGEYSIKFSLYGIKHIDYTIQRESLNPFKERVFVENIYKAIVPLKLDILHTFTAKPNIYGTFAATRAKVPVILNLIEGLGSFYVENSVKNRLIRFMIEKLYKKAFQLSQKAVFVNSDDPSYMIKRGLIEEDKVKIIKSVGIDTEEFSMSKISDVSLLKKSLGLKDEIVVLMVARAIWHKGVREFYEVASMFERKKVKFILVGDIDKGNHSSASKEFLQNGNVVWLGHRDDIKELTALCDIYVLPSYREGVPRTLLEAASMAKPIVTTDTVGCREVVDDAVNGFLVPVKDTMVLFEKIDLLVKNAPLREEMGKKGREKAVKEFDIKNIVSQYLELYSEYVDV
jgi:N,N'-diacetylbacillosaminyl-diphospho-undecaprenol alpha-1,3-N-acetylgalactosaminyltransferase